jgi:progressive ankylosis protein
MIPQNTAFKNISIKRIFDTWWPLAFSWLLMGAELPALSAVIARLPNPEINLAAYGGIVFPLALIVEAPVIMLLAASTALSKDWVSYLKIRRFMMVVGGSMTALHILIAFTPLYYFVVEQVIGVPPEIVEPGRIGLMIMTPWTWSIAYRRFNQGVLIRFGHSRAISIGTIIRLSADALVLTIGFGMVTLPGIVVATLAVSAGVISEAVYVGIVVKPVLKNELKPAPPVTPVLTLRAFLDFYIPLAMTSLLFLLAQPIGSAAISRMPRALESLAVWPVVTGLIFMFRSLGVAYNEVVVALLDEPRSYTNLKRFTTWLSVLSTAALLIMALTPLSTWWFGQISALSPELTEMARLALLIAFPLPLFSVLQSWYQGAILHGRVTRGVTEAVVIYLVVSGVLYWIGVRWAQAAGLYIGIAVMGISMGAQTAWLWKSSSPVMRDIRKEDDRLATTTMAQAMPGESASG